MEQKNVDEIRTNPGWHFYVLLAAGCYNIVWGAVAIFFPTQTFAFFGMDLPRYPQFWQCIGMIVGVYGLGYIIAASDSAKHWPIILVGFLGKIFGPIGFVESLLSGKLPFVFGLNIITNDIIWWIPFWFILKHAYQKHFVPESLHFSGEQVLDQMHDDTSKRSLGEISEHETLLLVFLRHSGCTFCRETLSNLDQLEKEIHTLKVCIVLVHMSKSLSIESKAAFKHYSVSNPSASYYKAFALPRGRLSQLFGLRVSMKGVLSFFKGHGIGPLEGDGFQLPGYFLAQKRKITPLYFPKDAADIPDNQHLMRLLNERVTH